MKTHVTRQGETFDSIAYDEYGDEGKYLHYLAQANYPLLDTLVFDAGVTLNVPDIPPDAPENVPFWRKSR